MLHKNHYNEIPLRNINFHAVNAARQLQELFFLINYFNNLIQRSMEQVFKTH